MVYMGDDEVFETAIPAEAMSTLTKEYRQGEMKDACWASSILHEENELIKIIDLKMCNLSRKRRVSTRAELQIQKLKAGK